MPIGVSSIGAGGARAPPDFQKSFQQCTILSKAVQYFEQKYSLLDVIFYKNREYEFRTSAYGWIWAVHFFGAPPKKRGRNVYACRSWTGSWWKMEDGILRVMCCQAWHCTDWKLMAICCQMKYSLWRCAAISLTDLWSRLAGRSFMPSWGMPDEI